MIYNGFLHDQIKITTMNWEVKGHLQIIKSNVGIYLRPTMILSYNIFHARPLSILHTYLQYITHIFYQELYKEKTRTTAT